MENAGNDVWEEILKRVPAISLGQCLCVCKSWYSLILSPHFIASHLQTQTQTQTLLRDLTTTQKPGKEIYRLVSNSDPRFETRRSFPCPFKAHQKKLNLRVVGTLHGLIFLSDDIFGYTFILWNPLVGKCVNLLKPRANPDLIGDNVSALGLGYDSVNDDYKVVRLCYPQDKDGFDVIPPLVEVFSVKEGGDWRPVNAEGVSYCIVEKGWYQCFLRGAVHWVVFDTKRSDRTFKSNLVLLFDVEQERFKRMKLPSPLAEGYPYFVTICEFRGMLAVIHIQKFFGPTETKLMAQLTCFDLWVKKRYNDGKSWSKMFSIDEGVGICKVLHVRGNGDILGLALKNDPNMFENEQKEFELVCYNTGTKEMVHLPGQGDFRIFFAGSFTESLVFLGSYSPAVSCDSRGGVANVEKDDERGSSSEDEETPSENRERMSSFCPMLVRIM